MASLVIKDLSLLYPDAKEPTLKDINLSVSGGQLVLLCGRTGIGKTSLLKVLSRLIPEECEGDIRGDVIVNGQSISGMAIVDMAKAIGFVSQDPEAQIFHETVHREMLFGPENLGIPKAEAYRQEAWSLSAWKLDPNQKTLSLSGGQKALLMVSAILAMDRPILILDEPLANLDIANALRLLRLLKTLAKTQGKLILLAEHRTDLVLPFADLSYHLANGHLLPGIGEAETQKTLLPIKGFSDFSHAPVLESATDLSVQYDHKPILSDVSLSIHPGETVAILGTNGQGKTTLLNRLSGLVNPNRGKASPIRQTIVRKRFGSRAWFSHVAMVFQNPSYELFNDTVQEELCFHVPDKEDALKMGEALGLAPMFGRHPQSLSEGEKRKVTIAAALAKKPDILFLDEPTVGQDHQSLLKILTLLNAVSKERKMATVLVTHDESVALALADSAYLLSDHRLTPLASPKAIADYFQSLRDKADSLSKEAEKAP